MASSRQHEQSERKFISSNLSPQAKEFIPGLTTLNLHAEEYVPLAPQVVPIETLDKRANETRQEFRPEIKQEEFEEADYFDPYYLFSASSTFPSPPRKTLQFQGIPFPLWKHYQQQNLTMLKSLSPDDERLKEIPNDYHSIFPLDASNMLSGATGSFGYPSVIYKVVSKQDGLIYTLRRFDIRTTENIINEVIESWRAVTHRSINPLHTILLQNKAVFFIHDYFPGAKSLKQLFLDNNNLELDEKMLWSIIVQISTAIRAIHSHRIAYRMVHPNHILMTSGNRIRLNSVGVADVLNYEAHRTFDELQREDLRNFAQLILRLGCRSEYNERTALNSFEKSYSGELVSFVTALQSEKLTSINQLFPQLATHLADELDTSYENLDSLDSHLALEYDNGRVLKLLLKLGLINERPEYRTNPNWSETGDRYILKLFRDYVFHQVDERGKPVIDFGHIIESLNKLDIGDSEQILLTSPDQRSIIVTSYADIRNCLEISFTELFNSQNRQL